MAADLVVHALVQRLKKAYWPKEIFHIYTLDLVLKAPPMPDYLHENLRPCPAQEPRKAFRWNRGRVHHFYNQLKQGKEVDPISVETYVFPARSGGPPAWGPPEVVDGHHRFAAAVLAEVERIPMGFGGLVRQENWLTGKTDKVPEEL